MKNKAKPNDFHIEVNGVGHFRFNRKNYGAQIRIDAVIARILGPNHTPATPEQEMEVDSVMRMHANIVSLYSSLMVDCPPGWEDIEAIDLTEEPEKDQQILDLYLALRDRLHSFRLSKGTQGAGEAGQGSGAPAVSNDAVLGEGPLPDPAH
jgi:hypothetical protein